MHMMQLTGRTWGLACLVSIGLLAIGVPAQERVAMKKPPEQPVAANSRVLRVLKPDERTRGTVRVIFCVSPMGDSSSSGRVSAGTGGDHDPADLVAIVSDDGGLSWSKPRVVVASEGGMNVMSVTLRRLPDDRIDILLSREALS